MRERRTLSVHRVAPVLAALGLALGATLAGCGRDDGTAGAALPAANRPAAEPAPPAEAPATASESTPVKATPPADTGTPQISFEDRFHDFGLVNDTEKVRASYTFTNSGTSTLVINEVKAGCGCTVPSLEKYEYAPGESGDIEIVFDPKGREGKTSKYVTVRSNSKVENVLQLRFAAEIAPLVSIDRFLQLGTIPLGREHKATVTARYADPDLRFDEVSINDEHITAELVEVGVVDDSSAQDRITYRATIEMTAGEDMPWGTLYAKRLRMSVHGRTSPEAEPIDYDYSVYVQGNVYGEIEASTASRGRAASPTSTISFSSVPAGEPFEASLQLTRTNGDPFTVTDVVVDETTFDGVEVRSEQTAPNVWNIVVFGNPGDYTGSLRGVIRVLTDVPGEEVLPVRFAGRVK